MMHEAREAGTMVLVVDDDVGVRNSIKFSLEVEGFVVRVYADAGDLLRAAELPAEACLVAEYNLRGMSGLELLEALRERGLHWPAILIASQPTGGVCRRAAAAGMSVIEKPLLGEVLVRAVRDAMSAKCEH